MKFGKYIRKTWKSFKNAPAIKGHLDFIAVVISILLSSLLLLQTARNLHSSTGPTPTPTPEQTTRTIVVTQPPNQEATKSPPTLPPETCTKGLAQTTIDSPNEGDTLNSNPVCITINYHQENYCSAVWSYRINGNNWSDYGNDSPCFYNLPSGNITFDVRVKSLVTIDMQTLTRHFTYQNNSATSSATTQ